MMTANYSRKWMMAGLLAFSAFTSPVMAQHNGLVDMSHSKEARMVNMPLGSIRWTGGFWGGRFKVFSETSLWDMWKTWDTPEVSHGFRNFEIAAGDAEGEHWGPPFHDGDMYKWLEACASVYAVTHDQKLDALMDRFIAEVAKAQRTDGYIHTPVVIDERHKGIDTHALKDRKDEAEIGITVGGKDEKGAFASRLNFETYNLGHLMTAGIVHWRATGKKTLFNCALKAADFLYDFLKNQRDELARNAICPSHYMAASEMYRATGDKRYLELAEGLIAIRDEVKNGEDHNQDRHPFREQYEAMGHAVRANYLYAGVADLYAETGEKQLMKNLSSIWDDITYRKIYITGGCGALYDGVSPDGTTYDQPSIQQIHQAYGRAYQLPNETSHNETCAQIGNIFLSWRMLETTADARYMDMVENELLNGVLPGISLDGTRYFYTQALRRTGDFPYVMRWPKTRQKYISCFCCPPNTLRALCEAQEYAYAVKGDTLWVNMYGDNHLKTKDVDMEMTSGYPYDGKVSIRINKAKNIRTLMLRVPGEGRYEAISATDSKGRQTGWKKGTLVERTFDMKPRLVEANPLVEENKNQIAVMRGPIVYCLENVDIDASSVPASCKDKYGRVSVNDIVIPADIQWTEVKKTIDGHEFVALQGEALLAEKGTAASWQKNQLYRTLAPAQKKVNVTLIPYYAWDNRGSDVEMSVWLSVRK